jgi:hypothetical protein
LRCIAGGGQQAGLEVARDIGVGDALRALMIMELCDSNRNSSTEDDGGA